MCRPGELDGGALVQQGEAPGGVQRAEWTLGVGRLGAGGRTVLEVQRGALRQHSGAVVAVQRDVVRQIQFVDLLQEHPVLRLKVKPGAVLHGHIALGHGQVDPLLADLLCGGGGHGIGAAVLVQAVIVRVDQPCPAHFAGDAANGSAGLIGEALQLRPDRNGGQQHQSKKWQQPLGHQNDPAAASQAAGGWRPADTGGRRGHQLLPGAAWSSDRLGGADMHVRPPLPAAGRGRAARRAARRPGPPRTAR